MKLRRREVLAEREARTHGALVSGGYGCDGGRNIAPVQRVPAAQGFIVKGALKPAPALRPGGVVLRDEAVRPRTAGWRTGLRPEVDLSLCVNCLLCWLYCPDSAVALEGTTFAGFDYEVCKGCEICAAICPVEAITMSPELDDGD